MSTQVLDRVSDVQEQIIEVLASVKEPITQAIDSIVGLVTDRVDIPAIPFGSEIPTPKEIIDNHAKFATKVIATNKAVALSAARAASPLTDPLLDRKAARPATASKPTASKTTAPKTTAPKSAA